MIKVNPDFTRFLVNQYGKDAQLGTLAEEGIEFSKEFLKYLFRHDTDKYWKNMEGEFADLLIMTEQGKIIFDMDKIHAIMKWKLDRLCKRLDESCLEYPKPYTEVD